MIIAGISDYFYLHMNSNHQNCIYTFASEITKITDLKQILLLVCERLSNDERHMNLWLIKIKLIDQQP